MLSYGAIGTDQQMKMDYSTYRKQFETIEEFRHAYSKLTESEVRELIRNDHSNTICKAAMYAEWQSCIKEHSHERNDQLSND